MASVQLMGATLVLVLAPILCHITSIRKTIIPEFNSLLKIDLFKHLQVDSGDSIEERAAPNVSTVVFELFTR
jgi:hypothetical protein